MKRFLIINPFGIGDVLFTTPVIRAIKNYDPNAYIGYWCNRRVGDLFENDHRINKVFALSRGDLKKILQKSRLEGMRQVLDLIFRIKKEKFDTCLDYSLDQRYGLVCALAGIKRRVGFDYKKRGLFLTDKVPLSGYSGRHAAEYYQDLLRLLGIAPVPGDIELPASAAMAAKAKSVFKCFGIETGVPLIGISAAGGTSWGVDARLKHWPAIKFTQLIDTLSKSLAAHFILLGDESERPIAEVIAMASGQKVTDLVGKLTIEELIAVISALDLLITNDGGSFHIAVACRVKTVSLFGPTDPKVYGPYTTQPDKHVVLSGRAECSPCYRDFRYPICLKNTCLANIGVKEVSEAALKLLSEK